MAVGTTPAERSARRRRAVPWQPYALVVAVTAALAAWHFAAGVTEASLQLYARHTARLSFLVFLPSFVASSLAVLAPSAAMRTLVRSRRHLGLAFALAHFIHLGALVSYFVWTDNSPAPIAIVFGGLGYVFIALLALTSTDAAVARLRGKWKGLHTVGVYYVWFIFTQSYAGRVFAGAGSGDPLERASEPVVYQLLLAVALLALLVRGLRRLKLKRAAPAPPKGVQG